MTKSVVTTVLAAAALLSGTAAFAAGTKQTTHTTVTKTQAPKAHPTTHATKAVKTTTVKKTK